MKKGILKKISLISAVVLLFLLIGCTDFYEKGEEKFIAKDYESALDFYKVIKNSDKKYNLALSRINEIDSILYEKRKLQAQIDSIAIAKNIIDRIAKAKQDSIANAEKVEKDRIDRIAQAKQDSIAQIQRQKTYILSLKNKLNDEILKVKNYKSPEYIYNLSQCKEEITIFGNWVDLIKKVEKIEDKELRGLVKILKAKVVKIQKTHFPNLRKDFAYIYRDKLSVNDVKVTTWDTDRSTLVFIGSTFTEYKNKKDFQNLILESLYLLRFKSTVYKWSEYDDDYSTFSVATPNDGEMIDTNEMKSYSRYSK